MLTPTADPCAGPLRPDEIALAERARAQARALFWVALVLVVASFAWIPFAWPTMPAQMPQHTGLNGPDAWVDKGRWLGVTLALTGLLSASLLAGPWLIAKIPMELTNSTHPDYWKTPERYPISMALVARFWYIVMGLGLVLSTTSSVAAWWAGQGHPYPQTWSAGSVALLFVAMAIEIVRMFRVMRPPQWWRDCRAQAGVTAQST